MFGETTCEPLHDEFLGLMSRKTVVSTWVSSRLLVSYFEAMSLIFDRAMTYFTGTHETNDNVSGVHLSKLLTAGANI